MLVLKMRNSFLKNLPFMKEMLCRQKLSLEPDALKLLRSFAGAPLMWIPTYQMNGLRGSAWMYYTNETFCFYAIIELSSFSFHGHRALFLKTFSPWSKPQCFAGGWETRLSIGMWELWKPETLAESGDRKYAAVAECTEWEDGFLSCSAMRYVYSNAE